MATRLTSVDSLSPLFIGFLLFAIALIFGSCGNDDEGDFSADIARVVGTYSVADKDEDNEVENYTVTIIKSGNGVEISNFGDIMYVPVKATFKGNTFTIPSQKTDDDYFLEHSCEVTKQV